MNQTYSNKTEANKIFENVNKTDKIRDHDFTTLQSPGTVSTAHHFLRILNSATVMCETNYLHSQIRRKSVVLFRRGVQQAKSTLK